MSDSGPNKGATKQVSGTASSLPANKRYIATHDGNGKSVYLDSEDQKFWVMDGLGGLARSFAFTSFPVDMENDADLMAFRADDGAASHTQKDIVVPGGINLAVVDLLPGMISGMHATASIDFAICVLGQIDHELDGGEKVKLYPGDHIVQRGTTHRWINPSETEPARFVAVTIAAKPFEIPGKGLLEEKHVTTASAATPRKPGSAPTNETNTPSTKTCKVLC